MREKVNPNALVNWYRLLWHAQAERLPSHLNECLKDMDLARLERELFALLHYYPRDDISIMVCVFRVWALARMCLVDEHAFGNENANATEKISFAEIEQFHLPDHEPDHALRQLENAIAYLSGVPVPEQLIPPLYRQNAPLHMPGVEITDDGLLILFALWHQLLLERFVLAVPYSSCSVVDPFDHETAHTGPALVDEDYRLLDRILGMEKIPQQVIFSCYSNPNPFTLIKRSGADFDAQTKMAGQLFDHEPSLYRNSPLGGLLLLARESRLPFFVNDDMLFSFQTSEQAKLAIWVFYSLEQKFCSLVLGRHVLARFLLGPESESCQSLLSNMKRLISTNLAPLSTAPEAAMEEET